MRHFQRVVAVCSPDERSDIRGNLSRMSLTLMRATHVYPFVIARSEATTQSRLPPRQDSGLLRFARNDGRKFCK
jgi:hypothetical protein